MSPEWRVRFMRLAMEVSNWSKDPSTKVGAIIVNTDKRVVGLGYNGFARGVADHEERYENREFKYKIVVHAEVNAILNAVGPVKGSVIFTWPFQPCSSCAGMIVNAGIQTVYFPIHRRGSPYREKVDRWKENFALSNMVFKESGVNCYGIYGGPNEW